MAKENKKIVQSEICIGCGICDSVCPINTKLAKKDDFNHDTAKLAIRVRDGSAIVNEDTCIACGSCVRSCPVESLSIVVVAAA
ncbi:MAG: 4Fe-4S dicluster domain-containing protein [Methanosarcinaceae archaeon]